MGIKVFEGNQLFKKMFEHLDELIHVHFMEVFHRKYLRE